MAPAVAREKFPVAMHIAGRIPGRMGLPATQSVYVCVVFFLQDRMSEMDIQSQAEGKQFQGLCFQEVLTASTRQ